jgi:hypothetical protein
MALQLLEFLNHPLIQFTPSGSLEEPAPPWGLLPQDLIAESPSARSREAGAGRVAEDYLHSLSAVILEVFEALQGPNSFTCSGYATPSVFCRTRHWSRPGSTGT